MNADLLNVINRIREVQVRARKSHSYFVQIGAGAGDLDPRAHHRDGFTEIIKSLSLSSTDKIILGSL